MSANEIKETKAQLNELKEQPVWMVADRTVSIFEDRFEMNVPKLVPRNKVSTFLGEGLTYYNETPDTVFLEELDPLMKTLIFQDVNIDKVYVPNERPDINFTTARVFYLKPDSVLREYKNNLRDFGETIKIEGKTVYWMKGKNSVEFVWFKDNFVFRIEVLGDTSTSSLKDVGTSVVSQIIKYYE